MGNKSFISGLVMGIVFAAGLFLGGISRAGGPQATGINDHNVAWIVDDSGKKVLEMFAIGNEPNLTMRDESGKIRLWLQVSNGAPKIVMYRGKESRALTFDDLRPRARR